MKNILPLLLITAALFNSCTNDQSKVEELEKKLEQQSDEMKSMKEDMLEKELEQKNKEIEELKSKDKAPVTQQENSGNKSNYYAQGFGKYPTASSRILTYDDVAYLNKDELNIMRNEIFARHGFIFKTEKMIEYFIKQSWYRPMYSDVNASLTTIEQKNIQFIKSFE